jgi:DNA invertase Pin-like site-specific DNA recombinase
VHRVDRLARHIADLTTILDTLRRESVALHSATEPLDTSTQQGQVLADLITGLVEFGREMPQVRPSRGVEPRRHRAHRTLRRGTANGG